MIRGKSTRGHVRPPLVRWSAPTPANWLVTLACGCVGQIDGPPDTMVPGVTTFVCRTHGSQLAVRRKPVPHADATRFAPGQFKPLAKHAPREIRGTHGRTRD